MEKRYQVFVSSTYRDLQDARAAVIQALLELDCIPAGMEMFPASDQSQWELIQRVIDDCDYYIVIIGGVYGSTDEAGISYTEKEYDYAISKGKPVLAFPHEDPAAIPAGKVEMTEQAQAKLKAFRGKATKDKMAKFWTSPEDLGGKVSRSLVQLIKAHPAEGWIKGRYGSGSERVLELQDRVELLQTALDAAKTTPPVGVDTMAQGDDPCFVKFQVSVEGNTVYQQLDTTWDSVIAVLGPLMFDGCSERRLARALEEVIELKVRSGGGDIYGLRLLGESFQTIKVQLIALGLIRKSDRRRAATDMETYWSLTPYGEYYVTKLNAVRRASG